MLFINDTSSTQAAKDYFTRQLSPSDYYMRDSADLAGVWHGQGAQMLGLEGNVDQESYFRMCENENPVTGEKLTPRTKTNRRILYDFTFDAPKSVSLAYEVGGDERILDAFRGAVEETMSEMESSMQTRVRKDGAQENRQTSNMVWAEFIHRTTRPIDGVPDPQLHCHAVTFNATHDPVEDRWKAGEFSDLVRDKGYYQAAFHSRLAGKLTELGYGIERDGKSFKLRGIERETCDKFSRRSEQIEEEAKRLGITDPKTKSELGRRTREAKSEEEKSATELRQEWRSRVTEEEQDGITSARKGQETHTLDAPQAMDYALSHCFERDSVVTQKELLKQALIHGVGKASVGQVQNEANRANIIRKEVKGQRYVTTKDVYREEVSMVNFARDGRGKHMKLGGVTSPALDPALSDEQREAALVILNSRDTVTGLKGGAGTGKTRMMQATVTAIEATGKKVFTFAPSAEASRGVLRMEGFSNAETVERLLIDTKMQQQVHGQVLWVDEAGLLSVKDMKRLFDLAKAQECRIVLSGDSKQHNAVMRGDALRLLENEAGIKFATLKTVRRQINEAYREAITAISQGDEPGKDGKTQLQNGIETLDKMGAIIETKGEQRYEQIANDYVAATCEYKPDGMLKTALVVSPTHAEADHVTRAIREKLKTTGRIGRQEKDFLSLKPLNLTQAERGDADSYKLGQVIQFNQNAKGFIRGERVRVEKITRLNGQSPQVEVVHADGRRAVLPLTEAERFQVYKPQFLPLSTGDKLRITQNGFSAARPGLEKARLNNGAVYEVESFTRQGDIKLTNGFVLPKEYGNIAYGYTVTSHASQGKTVDTVLIALGQESLAATNREQFYVSASRGREAMRLYTDDKDAMLNAIQDTNARLSATELMRGQVPRRRPRPGIMRQLFQIQRTQRIYDVLLHEHMTDEHHHHDRKGIGLV